MRKLSKVHEGVCKLTKQRGRFVDSHLFPHALMRLRADGGPSFQFEMGRPPTRRWTSWYDGELVTQQGEEILAALDGWAVKTLREHKLVWSGWGTKSTLGGNHDPIGDSPWGIRAVDGINPRKLRLFFLSLLWRVAVTSRPEFSDVELSETDVEQLRTMICEGNAQPLSFYPAQLSQLSTRGVPHNYAPTADQKRFPQLGEGIPTELPMFRFFLDGLIVHVHRHASDDGFTSDLGNLIVGAADRLILSTHKYSSSKQAGIVSFIMKGTWTSEKVG